MINQINKIAAEVLKLEASELNRHADMLDADSVATCGFKKAIEIIQNCKGKLIITGVGKSGHIAAKIAATLASTGTSSFFLHPTEALHGDLGMIGQNDCVLAISFSGESSELLAILPHIKRRQIPIITMSKANSSLANLSSANINLDIIKEACPLGAAPTVSTTLTLALGDALAVVLMKLNDFKEGDFAAFHPGGSLGKRLFLKVADVMRKELPLANENTPLKIAISLMSEGKLGTLILTGDNGRLSAVLSDGDLRRALCSDDFSLNDPAIKYATKNPKTINDPQMLAIDALKFIEAHKIQLLIITSGYGDRILGVLHIHDLTSLGL